MTHWPWSGGDKVELIPLSEVAYWLIKERVSDQTNFEEMLTIAASKKHGPHYETRWSPCILSDTRQLVDRSWMSYGKMTLNDNGTAGCFAKERKLVETP